jgi:transcriptional/translational regulatory protein YebC/TACO1
LLGFEESRKKHTPLPAAFVGPTPHTPLSQKTTHTGKRPQQNSVKAGGADPATNSKLSDLLKQARDLGVPKDVLERNMKRATDAKQADFAETVYEAYGPGGTG